MDWTLFAIASVLLFLFLHFVVKFHLSWPIRLHHSIIGWIYVALGVGVWNIPTVLAGLFLVTHHFVTEGTII